MYLLHMQVSSGPHCIALWDSRNRPGWLACEKGKQSQTLHSSWFNTLPPNSLSKDLFWPCYLPMVSYYKIKFKVFSAPLPACPPTYSLGTPWTSRCFPNKGIHIHFHALNMPRMLYLDHRWGKTHDVHKTPITTSEEWWATPLRSLRMLSQLLPGTLVRNWPALTFGLTNWPKTQCCSRR